MTTNIFSWDSQADYDDWLNDLVRDAPESWDMDAAQEYVVTQYVHELERRVLALGGSLCRWDGAE